METQHYKLLCPACGTLYDDDGTMLQCSGDHLPALLTTEYLFDNFVDDQSEAEGISRYRYWLPIHHPPAHQATTITYRSHRLCQFTGLANLWIAFNGYWPEKSATFETASFKELEALTVCARIPEADGRVLVIASAGNTAAAFAHLCSSQKIPCLIIIPSTAFGKMKFTRSLDPCVRIISLIEHAEYSDAILLADRISRHPGFIAEGGVKNVARRDGIGTTLLNAIEAIGRLPDYYFQAIGSGTGGIAVHQTARRVIKRGGFGNCLPRLMLSQNSPFAPIYHSWKAQSLKFITIDEEAAKHQIQQMVARVLSHQQPPYSIQGGVFDVLQESQGDMLVADNRETLAAMHLFEEIEGIDIDPAAGVAFAALIKAVQSGRVVPSATIVLHITGGGWRRRQQETQLIPATPALQISKDQISTEETLQKILSLF